jgi:hypothetical protein
VIDDLSLLDAFLDQTYTAHERVARADLQRGAVAADLPATVLTRIDALPEGEYSQDEAAEALRALPDQEGESAMAQDREREAIGDPQLDDTVDDDFAEEHDDTAVDPDITAGRDSGESESPRSWTGMDNDGMP